MAKMASPLESKISVSMNPHIADVSLPFFIKNSQLLGLCAIRL
ncbi:hypothetical protein swp_3959 [Shewanella piezotolerans WP3]|uniref:Uncharacterized protein n=1 Tax=Shewanella piezotolerans (strain WP3 / JCM 13877) TaxID=225849 RepID=B8CSK3_SHEPW|nr:hypothetical protein swp_3959 [Shewanella piezotolerans WP3]